MATAPRGERWVHDESSRMERPKVKQPILLSAILTAVHSLQEWSKNHPDDKNALQDWDEGHVEALEKAAPFSAYFDLDNKLSQVSNDLEALLSYLRNHGQHLELTLGDRPVEGREVRLSNGRPYLFDKVTFSPEAKIAVYRAIKTEVPVDMPESSDYYNSHQLYLGNAVDGAIPLFKLPRILKAGGDLTAVESPGRADRLLRAPLPEEVFVSSTD